MSAINWHDIRSLQNTPVENGFVECEEKMTPELNVIPSVTIASDRFEFWKHDRKDDIRTGIFVKPGEGVCPEKTAWSKEERSLQTIERVAEIDCQTDRTQNASARAATGQPFDIFEETMMYEMKNIRERMVRQMYLGRRLGEDSGYFGLDELSCLCVNVLDPEWNCEKSFVSDLENPDPAELADLGPLVSGYLIFASPRGLRWIWGLGGQIDIGPERIVERIDSKKTAETGRHCTYEAKTRRIKGTIGLTTYCKYDVVKLCNIPCKKLDGFYLDNVLDTVLGDVYQNSTVRPNLALLPSNTITNWHMARKKQGIENGGCCYIDVGGRRFNVYNDEVAIQRSYCIPESPYENGNVDLKEIIFAD